MTNTTQTQRVLPFSPEQVYAAFANAKTLATWWGPDGFTNEFETFEFKTGGHWKFTMIAPNGTRYANQNIFLELKPAAKVVIRHDGAPFFKLTVTLAPHADGTLLHWEQTFDDANVFEAVKHIVVPANEQNLNRLEAVLKR
jgi:uncharacterized protein YndB with AHSA1/START domain